MKTSKTAKKTTTTKKPVDKAKKKFFRINMDYGCGPHAHETIIVTEKEKKSFLDRLSKCDPDVMIDEDGYEMYELEPAEIEEWIRKAKPITWDEIQVLRKHVDIMDGDMFNFFIQEFEEESGIEPKKNPIYNYIGKFAFEMEE